MTTTPAVAELPARRRPRPTSSAARRKDTLPGILMAAPGVGALAFFVAVPFVLAIVLSLYNVQIASPRPARFVGLLQYERLFTDPIVSGPFFRALLNNLTFAVFVIPVQTGLALLLAVLVNAKLRGVAFFRTLFFMPVVFPMALVAVIWRLILDRSGNGMLNTVLHVLSGGAFGAHDWLGSSSTAMASIIVLSVWQGAGFQMVIILAALQEIPQERYEAASIDRASTFQQFVHITVPGIRNTLVFVTLLTTIFAFRVYDQVYILISTAGANEEATQTVLYQATSSIFDTNNLGRACAITVVFFAIVMVITLVQRRLVRQTEDGA
ncbi:sugar ABC transporter permease [Kineococcus sp. NPDC059986]|jgi:multiple sugar transport system permease protein|uniref:carbohydrate ABC transporter permease n=1 Tax=Kineococcus sp. NPDC059986 TaxID=3155538 RepID=UPI00344CDF0D